MAIASGPQQSLSLVNAAAVLRRLDAQSSWKVGGLAARGAEDFVLELPPAAFNDAARELGGIARIRDTFIGFQKHLYARVG